MSAANGAAFLDEMARRRKAREFPVVWLADAQLPPGSPAIVKGLIEQKTLAVIYGESGSGKTFFSIDLVFHIVQGIPWRSRKVKPVLVAYVAAEAGTSILKRFLAVRDNKLGDVAEPGPLAILTRGPNLLDDLDVAALLEQLKALSAQAGLSLGVVVFDTLSRSIPGGDENLSADMTRLVHVADRIREELGAATVLVHHTGKDRAKGPRGHSALFSAADTVVCVADGVATVEKLRDGVAGQQFPFKLEVVNLGTDTDGDAVTTCLVDHTAEATPPPRRDDRLTGVAKVALQALQELLSEAGEPMAGSSTIPRGVRAVKIDGWRSRFRLRYGNDDEGAERGGSAVKKAFTRAREALLKARLVSISDPWCWLT
jgi:KaiC/GvpD/RAD55 family RecA-like ATPase